MNNVYLYIHRNPVTYEIFYVGIGINDRAFHLRYTKRNILWGKYVRKHGKPIVQIIQKDLSRDDAAELEELIISLLGRKVANDGILTNISTGGENSRIGTIASKETREKISVSAKGRTPWNKGKEFSEGSRNKMSIAKKGVSPWNKGKQFSEDSKRKMSEAKKGKSLKPVEMILESGEVIKNFDSVTIAADYVGLKANTISMVCTGKRKRAGGHIFRFAI